MEPLTLKPRPPVEENIENWDDDDDFLLDNDDLTFRSSSSMTSHANRRDSSSSFRSDRESLPGRDERHVHMPDEDEKSTLDAIAAAAHAGIPIPANVPSSALMGGTIKRLGGRKVKKIFQEDWADDIELPDAGQALQVKPQDPSKFPEALRQLSGASLTSPAKQTLAPSPIAKSLGSPEATSSASPVNLDKFRDADDDDVFGDGFGDGFADGAATIKAPKVRAAAEPVPLIIPPTPQRQTDDDEFEMDFELPSDGKLKLSRKKDIPKTPSTNHHDDFDWGEGSLGTRFGGTGRGPFSNRSSSVSALSPSIASSFTAESEDEHLDGLELPMGPLDLGERLKRRKLSRSPDRQEPDFGPRSSRPEETSRPTTADKDDFLAGLEIGDGDVFTSVKSTLHRNIKVKETRPTSPPRPKTAVSITFTNKPVMPSQNSRLPRAMSGHERASTQPSLEPVSESGGPIATRPSRRSQSRLSGHSAQSSVSSIHTPPTPTTSFVYQQSTPSRRRELGQKASTGALRAEPTTTSAQLLRLKRSLPVLRQGQSPAKQPTLSGSFSASRIDRPSSRGDAGRSSSYLRPRTPVDSTRSAHDSSAAMSRKVPAPFTTSGPSFAQRESSNNKTSRTFRRHDSDQGSRAASRTASRSTMRSPSPRRFRHEKHYSDSGWHQLSKPRRTRTFGDGHELDAFDDLPTSAQSESKFTKQAVGSGNRNGIRNKIYQNVLPDRNTPSPVSPYSPRNDFTPRFARDTAASRNAREANLAQRAPPAGPLAPLTTQRVAQLATRTTSNQSLPLQTHYHTMRPRKTRRPPQLKPHLISNLTGAKDAKVVNGMTYNPSTFCWEGNENALNAFNPPLSTPTSATMPGHLGRDKESLTPGPVLIKDMGSSKIRKQVGDMVFDPQNMCWIKVQPDQRTPTPRSGSLLEGFQVIEDDDPFKDIPDLEEKEATSGNVTRGRVSDVNDEWMVGEEFDVGPEFVRRQHEEEERWRKKCEKWVDTSTRDQDSWRWTIRDIIMSG